MTTLLVSHSASLDHDMGEGHPERPDRYRVVERALEAEAFQMLARDAARLQALEAELAGSRAWVCDVGVEADLRATVDAVVSAQGAPRVIVHNAVGGSFGNFNDIDPAVLTRNFEINTVALLHLARLLTPAMVAAGDGAIIVTGNTSALRGKPLFAGFAPTKAAQRILA